MSAPAAAAPTAAPAARPTPVVDSSSQSGSELSEGAAQADTPTSKSGLSQWQGFESCFSIGRGQFGVVYLLKHPDGRKAVDKRVGLTGMSDKEREETQREISLLRRLDSECVVTLLDPHSGVTPPLTVV